jgi:hypothetical protein
MWIVNLALRRPYTFIVLSIFILIVGVLSILRTPKDIFPAIDIPVISGDGPEGSGGTFNHSLRTRAYDHRRQYRAH